MTETGDDQEWTIAIYVPPAAAADQRGPDPAVEHHSLTGWLSGRVEKVEGRGLSGQWERTINTLLKLSSSVSDRLDQWQVDEMEVGLTLSAKGELLFIAEAGAEASIKLTLKRKV